MDKRQAGPKVPIPGKGNIATGIHKFVTKAYGIMNKQYILPIILMLVTLPVLGDGVVVPEEGYPYTFLKNKTTLVKVNIYGLIAETVVTQEFENETSDSVSGVWSFPLPPNARATRLQYSVGDTLVDAILKVQQQSTTPGTGSGGEIAELNRYMGINVLRLALNRIMPHQPKTVKLSYITVLDQYNGKYEYYYPHNTSDFVTNTLDHFQVDIRLHSSKAITSYSLNSHPGYRVIRDEPNDLEIRYAKSKAYATTDVHFTYEVGNAPLQMEVFGWTTDSTDAYFALVGKPQVEVADSSLAHEIVFVLSKTNTMIGNKFNQSREGIKLALDALSSGDRFSIIAYDGYTDKWNNEPVVANTTNINQAKSWLDNISLGYGSRLDLALIEALNMPGETDRMRSIVAFTDGRSPVDPEVIEDLNTQKAGICFIAIGQDIDRVRLEAVASRNYGFVSYLHVDRVVSADIANILSRLKSPLIKETKISITGPATWSLYPAKLPPVFAGTDFLVCGRFDITSMADMTLTGENLFGEINLYYQELFGKNNELARKLWARMAIDEYESRILIYGEHDSLKNKLIELSLDHNIRCRYTAFIEDDKYVDSGWDPDDEITLLFRQPIAARDFYNYPNPFSESTLIHLIAGRLNAGQTRILEFFDIHGRLIYRLDISEYPEGEIELPLHRSELGALAGRMVFVRFLEGNQQKGRMVMMVE